ncbi:MAG: T9SS type A sorting domain-containing protein [Cytophagales bacterium]|nr:T9SS type A sorting domain-containing protein [Cytophagales bacterium]
MRHYLQTFMGCFLALFAQTLYAQNDCPAYPSQSTWDESCYISANTPDPDATDRSSGKLYLPEAFFSGKYNGVQGQAARIPKNRPTWAIGMAHAWNYSRNIIKSPSYPKISLWMATITQESQWGCDAGAEWKAGTGSPTGVLVPTVGDDGCFQIEGINNGSAYGALIQYYPQRFRNNEHPNLIGGNNVETSALVKAYYNLFTQRIANYRWGWDYMGAVENTCDPFAFDKLSASAYNSGLYGFQGAQSFMTGQENNCYWSGLPATVGGYSSKIGDMMAVLEGGWFDYENNYQIASFTSQSSSFEGYYDADIQWSDMEDYLNAIDDMYWEVDFESDVRPQVIEAWTKVAGNTNTSIKFMDLGTVVDAIILALPKEDPLSASVSLSGFPQGPNGSACSGDNVPYASIDIEGETSVCLGQTTKLVANTLGQEGYTFKWKKEGVTIVSTDQELIVNEELGTHSYSLEVCNDNGCFESDCDISIEVTNCSTCSLTATATATNSTCTTSEDGKIDIVTSNGSATYNVKYSSDVYDGEFDLEAHDFTINNVPSGFYSIEITDLIDATCKAYASVLVDYTTENNEILNAELVSTQNCEAELEASLNALDESCSYQVRVAGVQVGFPFPTDTTYIQQGQWEEWIDAQITVNGNTTISKPNVLGYQWGENAWEISDFVSYNYRVETGDIIDFSLNFGGGTPGATQLQSYLFEVWNEDDQKVASYFVPAQSAISGQPYKAGSFEASCAATFPDYTYSWSPRVNSQTDTDESTTTIVDVSGIEDVEYVVTATNSAQPNCILRDTIVVEKDQACFVCNNPGTVTLNTTSNTIELCANEAFTLETTTSSKGAFVFELYEEDNLEESNSTGVFTLTSVGNYSVLVRDKNDTERTCASESIIIKVKRNFAPNEPTFTLFEDEVCEGDFTQQYTVKVVEDVNNYVWNYTGENTIINNALILTDGVEGNETVWLDFNQGATSGVLSVQAENGCGLSEPAIIDILVDKPFTPAVEIVASETQICEGDQVEALVNQQKGGVGATYVWTSSINGQIGEEEEILLTNLQDGEVISLEMTVQDNCVTKQTASSNQITFEVMKLVDPFVTIEASETTICGGTTVDFTILSQSGLGNNPTYTWMSTLQGDLGTDDNLTLSNLENGEIISLEIVDLPLCALVTTVTSNEVEMTVEVCTNLEEVQQTDITVYPNPTNGQLTINSDEEIEEVVVLSLDGKELVKTSNTTIDLSAYASGIYLVKVITQETTQVVRVEKK